MASANLRVAARVSSTSGAPAPITKNRSRVSNPKAAPPTQMRELLSASRRAGIAFDRAWATAWNQVRWPHDTEHRREWKELLDGDRLAWQAAYERKGEENRSLRALYSLLQQATEPTDERLIA
jgi:hypothetical protein